MVVSQLPSWRLPLSFCNSEFPPAPGRGRVVHVNQIKARVTELFNGKIDLTGAPTFGPDHDNFFLTRSLAAYSVHFLTGADVDLCAKSVVDGGDDNGIDAIFYDRGQKILFLVQAKWIHDGKGEPDNGSIKKFVAGVGDLLNLSFDRFNAKVKAKGDVRSLVEI